LYSLNYTNYVLNYFNDSIIFSRRLVTLWVKCFHDFMITLIAHNIRSAYNIGGLFRTADGIGVKKIYLTGYSPSPAQTDALYKTKAQKMLLKTALGAEENIKWSQSKSITRIIQKLKKEKFEVVALEQDVKSIDYTNFQPKYKDIAIIVGNEPKGIDMRILKKCDTIIEIPMHGKKKSLNVVTAFAVVGYHLISSIK